MTERALRILQVSTFDVKGGAAKVARELVQACRTRGHQAWLAVGTKRSEDPEVLVIPNRDRNGRWARFWFGAGAVIGSSRNLRVRRLLGPVWADLGERMAWLTRPLESLGVEDFDFPGTRRLLELPVSRPDIVHGHNLHGGPNLHGGYFDLRVLPQLSQRVPVVLTLHDAWLLSGHCAHSFDCARWMTGCGRCPDLTIPPAVKRDATAYNWRRKRRIFARSRVYVATPSRWLMKKVEQSMLVSAVAESRLIPNGVNLSIFCPADRRAARLALGVSDDECVLLFVAKCVETNPWKDYETVRAAITLVARARRGRRIRLIVLGGGASREWTEETEIECVPFLHDPMVVARYYQAADVYVHAAKADTFPSTVLEALACGTPVVATAVGGIPEQVDDGETGFLTPPGDAAAMGERIGRILASEDLRRRFSGRAVEVARARFDFERQVDRYLGWYRQIVTDRRRAQKHGVAP